MTRLHRLAWHFERFPHGPDSDSVEVEAFVSYRYTAGCPARINCDPDDGWDAQPAEAEIQEIVGADGKTIEATEAERLAIEAHIVENPPELGPDPDDERDRRLDDRDFDHIEYGECEQ